MDNESIVGFLGTVIAVVGVDRYIEYKDRKERNRRQDDRSRKTRHQDPDL